MTYYLVTKNETASGGQSYWAFSDTDLLDRAVDALGGGDPEYSPVDVIEITGGELAGARHGQELVAIALADEEAV